MKLLSLIVTLTIGVILAGSILLPAVSDAQNTLTAETRYNTDLASYGEGKYYTEDVTLLWDIEGSTIEDSTFYVNGTETAPYVSGTGIVPIAIGDDFMVFMHPYNTTNTVTGIYIYKDAEGYHDSQSYSTNGDITIEYDATEGTVTLSDGSGVKFTTQTSYFFGKCVEGTGDYILIKSSEFPDVVISQDAIDNNTGGVIAVWITTVTVGDTTYNCRAVSDIHGTFGITKVGSDIQEADVSLEFSGLTPLDKSSDLFSNGTPRFAWTIDGETKNSIISTSYVIKEVHGHIENGTGSIVGAIPVMVIATLLMVAVGAIILRTGRD